MFSILKMISFCLYLLLFPLVSDADEKTVFSTWDTFEADKCASIWLIKKYISPNSEIRFFKKGEVITEGIEFDTPNALFKRYHNKSTFEVLLDHYKLKEANLAYLGRIIHDIEINTWEKKQMKETPVLERDIGVILSSLDNERIEKECFQYFTKMFEGR